MKKDAWFNLYICYAMSKGIVAGNPDGLFHPERTVNYAEALKILTLIYGYDIVPEKTAAWAEPYYKAAKDRGTDLPVTIRFESPLTRGQVARLAAGFLAEKDGHLVEYRMAENGIYPDVSSSSSSVSSSASSQSSASSSSSAFSVSSSASSKGVYILPSASHFLVAGNVSDAIGDGIIKHAGENAHIRAIEIKLYQEVTALNSLKVYTDQGVEVATLTRRVNTSPPDYKQIYEVQLEPGVKDFAIMADKDMHLVVRADVRSIANNGASEQLLQIRTFSVTVQGDTTNQTVNYVLPAPFPMHQTAFAHMLSVRPAGAATGVLASGTGKLVASYSFSGSAIEGRSLYAENLIFSISKSDNVDVSKWTLRSSDGTQSIDCSFGSDGVSCQNIPSSMGVLGPQGVALNLHADIAAGPGTAFLQAELGKAGSPNELGSVQWTDQAGHFRWVEAGVIAGKGAKWQK